VDGPAESQPRSTRRNPVVLIVEDDQSSVDLLRAYLTDSGYDVLVERTGPEGLAAVRREQPDAVVLDIQLPGLDGWGSWPRSRQPRRPLASRWSSCPCSTTAPEAGTRARLRTS
jgi:CheY-like chemotaxis protein